MTADQKKIIDQVEKMTVLELNGLVKVLEKKVGVSAAAMVASGGSAAAGGGEEEQDSFTINLQSVGSSKIAIIKVIKEVLGLGLKEAKDLADAAPTVLKEEVPKEEAEAIKKQIEEAGGQAELK
ncbi:MAG: 50S ribosomal protein L7/L12 [Patescibacteria group bacterium]|nr:50S ribosomal protein L7/L12 [Patescibacteria group bacterium]